jgi:hypothetical protein
VGGALVGLAGGGPGACAGGAVVPVRPPGAEAVGVCFTVGLPDVVAEGCPEDSEATSDELATGVSVAAPEAESEAELAGLAGLVEPEPSETAEAVEFAAPAVAGAPDLALIESWLTA